MTTPTPTITPQAIVDFWRAAGPAAWFSKNADFDKTFRETFFDAHMMAARQELDAWMADANAALGLLLLLDQYPRNAFRDTAHMFATDHLARRYASEMIAAGLDQKIETSMRAFCYLPFEHAEDVGDQQRSVELSAQLDAEFVKYAHLHADIIKRFGRFPHRNAMLGRVSTIEEEQFLADGGFAG